MVNGKEFDGGFPQCAAINWMTISTEWDLPEFRNWGKSPKSGDLGYGIP